MSRVADPPTSVSKPTNLTEHEEAPAHKNLKDDNETSTIVSTTSTLSHNQEPHESFQTKAFNLILTLFPNHSMPDIQIAPHRSGPQHRILSIKVARDPSPTCLIPYWTSALLRCMSRARKVPTDKFILRIPRGNSKGIVYHIATLEFLRTHLSYPIPKNFILDTGVENPLNASYMIQHRLPGRPLDQLWSNLTHEMKVSVVRQLTPILRDIARLRNSKAGIVSWLNSSIDFAEYVKVEGFPVPGLQEVLRGTGDVKTVAPKKQSTIALLLELCARWREYEIENEGEEKIVWSGIENMIWKLYELGFMPDSDCFHFSHMDLKKRNVLVDVRNNRLKISGIVGWDVAAFVPKFVAYRGPFFLWCEDIDELDEKNALVEPKYIDASLAKNFFRDIADEDFLKYAFAPEYVLARRMFRLCQCGIRSDRALDEAEDVVHEFEQMYSLDG
ncbi:hypothetical protein B0J11DRAFT_448994 [Dendryphion nanum]|uniref:Aminoglycoside phosphotransferase domain-containing protein n=1 Tax=Dendryphion nanum TaxID=256645 RepID=A0A9P9CZ19_9PLEO|nr:hypothetical protein B0J11DRAFT_448994 [Dendryphion nanum]